MRGDSLRRTSRGVFPPHFADVCLCIWRQWSQEFKSHIVHVGGCLRSALLYNVNAWSWRGHALNLWGDVKLVACRNLHATTTSTLNITTVENSI